MEGYLIALIVAGVADAISFMVVSPSLIFYVLKQGGTKEQYGIIMSSFSLASFCAKPFVGYASDKLGFKLPYAISLGIACGGSLLYVMTNNISFSDNTTTIPFTNGMNPSVFGILLARLLMGVGAANSALGYAYVARVVPSDQQTSVNAFLSMGRIGGMSVGPGFNALLSQVHIGNFLNPLNSVGLIVLVCNLIAIAAVFIFLQEPPPIEEEEEDVIRSGDDTNIENDTEKANDKNDPKEVTPLLSSSSNSVQYSLFDKIVACMTTARIWVPICSIFMFNANFQFIETGFAPAASDGLGWGPVQISMVLGGLSIMVAAGFASVSYLSGKLKICDEHLLMGGLVVNAISYACVYFGWKRNVSSLCYILPVAGGALSFPFLAVPTRTIYTNGVKTQPSLVKHMGSMQALLSMFASVAGFTIPTFVASYCNRPPEVVSEQNSHEMSKWTLVAPLMAIGVLIGVLYIHFFETEEETVTKVTQDEVNKKNVSPPERTTTTLTKESSSNLEGSSTTDTFKIELEPGQIKQICRASHTDGGGGTGTMRRSITAGSTTGRRRSSCRRPSSAYLRNSETISLMCQSVLDQSHCLSLDDDDDDDERVSNMDV